MLKTVCNAKFKFILAVVIVLAIVIGILIVPEAVNKTKSEPRVITTSTLEKIINVSELSTFTSQVMNNKTPEETDYYVSYDAIVYAGIDFKDIVISVDSASKTINIGIPKVYITEIKVDISSLDFIFYNNKVNQSSITQEAFTACENDVREESEQQPAILELAQQNAKNVVTALTRPIIEQLDSEYTLVIE